MAFSKAIYVFILLSPLANNLHRGRGRRDFSRDWFMPIPFKRMYGRQSGKVLETTTFVLVLQECTPMDTVQLRLFFVGLPLKFTVRLLAMFPIMFDLKQNFKHCYQGKNLT